MLTLPIDPFIQITLNVAYLRKELDLALISLSTGSTLFLTGAWMEISERSIASLIRLGSQDIVHKERVGFTKSNIGVIDIHYSCQRSCTSEKG